MLSSRGALPGFRWGIFIPTATPIGQVWHATNREGGWKLDPKTSPNVPFSLSLLLAKKIGAVNQSNWQTCVDILDGIPADGRPSPNTGEVFSCRVWVKDAIIALQNNGIITLGKALSELEDILLEGASDNKVGVERGRSRARVENSSV
ncbi:hypothetical protein BO71DRAFT_199916 [Aspergillus ellipticus CBS 707.79]|uniref:Uncharacterized protein n=1 Tax=Aspergillus ellipticus CBS 707.79 TaxID=1448320 RepID=A0A319DED6_9EURO|nr:hypothetical protein BO71DRAFT_199916 [Aspergillus ellipticus CBS 707.79]